ncbi:MAG: hypothetical protein ACFB2X_17335 [Rivularia sp. (in: cyanobacteria)]
MAQNSIPSSQTSNTPVVLGEFGESLEVFGTLEVSGEDPAVLAQDIRNRVEVEGGGVIRGETTGIQTTEIDTNIINEGTIDGGVDGIDFVNDSGASGRIRNKGTITSASRAINIGGNAVGVVNEGFITTTADPRNGTVYSDVTANNYFLDNRGLIDVGENLNGDAISWELGGNITTFIVNSGLAQGRGVPIENNLSSAVRLFRAPEGEQFVSFNGNIDNSGQLIAENGAAVVVQEGVVLNGSILNSGGISSVNSENGVGIDFVNGSQLNGEILNTGLINGGFTGVNFDNGGQVSGILRNKGTITSDSRAVNIGGDNIVVFNEGLITTTGDPRNGTVYSDVTANNYFLENFGTIDVGEGNNGDAISWELGGDIATSIVNSGLAQGRGVAIGNNLSSAVRLFRPDNDEIPEVVSFNGNIENFGTLAAENGATIAIQENVNLNGFIINDGTIDGGVYEDGQLAIDARDAADTVRVVSEGIINGDVLLSVNDDLFDGSQAGTSFVVDGGAGDDTIKGGFGADTLTGGDGSDNFVFNSFPSADGPDIVTDFTTAEDGLAFGGNNFGIDELNFQQAESSDLAGDSNLLVLLDPFANAGAAAAAIADSSITADEGVFIYFNQTLGFSRAVFSSDLGDNGSFNVLANLTSLTDPGVQGEFSADNFDLV